MPADPSRNYFLRSLRVDFTSHSWGHQWPREVGAEHRPEAWDPEPWDAEDHVDCCDGFDGLAGFLAGEGDAREAHWADDAQWLVFSAPVGAAVAADGGRYYKVAVARIEHIGSGATGDDRLQSCLAYLASIGRLGPRAMGIEREGGDGCTLTGGDCCILTGGARSTLTGGRDAILRGGDHSIISGGRFSALAGGCGSRLIWRDCGITVVVDGDRVKPHAFYVVGADGRPHEVEEDPEYGPGYRDVDGLWRHCHVDVGLELRLLGEHQRQTARR